MSTVYLVKSLFCRNISVEYEFKLEKLKACMLIVLNHAQATRKIFWGRILHGEPCCCLDVSVYMLKCGFCCDILLGNEFTRCVDICIHI